MTRDQMVRSLMQAAPDAQIRFRCYDPGNGEGVPLRLLCECVPEPPVCREEQGAEGQRVVVYECGCKRRPVVLTHSLGGTVRVEVSEP
jgi:hypothetical protein